MHRDAQLLGQRMPVVGLRPRDVDEVRGHELGPRLPHESRRNVEVVVVEHDGRIGLALELFERRRSKGLVHRDVAGVPRIVQPRVEVGSRAEPPEVVLQEPEGRVGEDVVVAVVRRRVVRDEAQPVPGAVTCLLLERALVLGRHGPVLLAHGACHPRHVVVREQAAERRDHAAPAPPGDAGAARITLIADRRAVGDDEELVARRCRV